MEMKVRDAVELVASWIANSQHLVAFTGAGVSTDSGLPDFRGPNGVWTRRDAGLPPPAWSKHPSQIEPNPSHEALVELERLGKLKFLISQNVDGLHLKSGFPAEKLAELHGNTDLLRCRACDSRYPQAQFPRGRPKCLRCGGRLVPSIVNFGDSLPEKDLRNSIEQSALCDVFFAIGSSLVVSPANLMPQIAVESGARLILLNQGDTPLDDAADLRIWSGVSEILPPVAERVREIIEYGDETPEMELNRIIKRAAGG